MSEAKSALDRLREKEGVVTELDLAVLYYAEDPGDAQQLEDGMRAAQELEDLLKWKEAVEEACSNDFIEPTTPYETLTRLIAWNCKQALAEQEESSADLHRDLNERTAKALGKPLSGDNSSWHDIPEQVEALVDKVAYANRIIENVRIELLKVVSHLGEDVGVSRLARSARRLIEIADLKYAVFQKWQKDLPEPYRTQCCNILANGSPDVGLPMPKLPSEDDV